MISSNLSFICIDTLLSFHHSWAYDRSQRTSTDTDNCQCVSCDAPERKMLKMTGKRTKRTAHLPPEHVWSLCWGSTFLKTSNCSCIRSNQANMRTAFCSLWKEWVEKNIRRQRTARNSSCSRGKSVLKASTRSSKSIRAANWRFSNNVILCAHSSRNLRLLVFQLKVIEAFVEWTIPLPTHPISPHSRWTVRPWHMNRWPPRDACESCRSSRPWDPTSAALSLSRTPLRCRLCRPKLS